MRKPILTILALFLAQIILVVYGTSIFQVEANPFALLIVTAMFTGYCFKALQNTVSDATPLLPSQKYLPWAHAFVGMLGLAFAYEELRKTWAKYPNPENISDVIPQLKAQCDRFFSGEFPYQLVKMPTYEAYPVYMPLHWLPIQISRVMGIDTRWSAVTFLLLALGIAGYWLSKTHSQAPWKLTLPAMLLLSMPLWGFLCWGQVDLAISLEGIVTAWYVLLAVGLASRNHFLIFSGLTGGIMSRYTFLFWAITFAILLWLNAPKKYSYWIWGGVFASCLVVFVIPFLMKDPTILSKIMTYYTDGEKNTWLHPDAYSFKDGLSLNIHLRHWLPGTPEENRPLAHLPQLGVQILLAGLAIFYYQKRWVKQLDVYTFGLILLPIMLFCFYIFSPMLFKYYMLAPLTVSAVLCWKVFAAKH